ncbi:type II toxin-antitoxin system TacA family antitoxin [Reichenbachiella ulvae]|uniref:DUF1778 domain-containing protein n=1 Tax=Reichenbachiella ulvae TaxID=2980104 RepID=A0ABT3CUQ9_9BACT|nr:DUF1778 domain-containing protein [Reichenbachiella ulvae]MCV9387293.1 DUF1778 domain-containing protein [Reichenbachiella ulvae]
MSTLSKDRIDVRISKEQKEFFKYASELRGFKSLSEFVIHCVFEESNKIIKDNNLIVNTIEDKERFIEAILNPPSPNANLRKAQLNYKNFIEASETNNRNSK